MKGRTPDALRSTVLFQYTISEGRIQLPTLAFSPDIETAYQQRALERGIRIARTAALIATPSIPLFIMWDHQVAPETAASATPVRLAIVVGFLLAWALTYTKAAKYFTVLEVLAFASITVGLPVIYYRLGVFELAAPSLLLPFVWIPVVAVRLRQAILDVVLSTSVPWGAMRAAEVDPAVVNNMLWWFLIAAAFSIGCWILVDKAYRSVFLAETALRAEQRRSDALLRNVLPDEIAERLKDSGEAVAERFANVTVMFADLVGFTAFTAASDASTVVELLNRLFSEFDDLVDHVGVEKIKTIGDGYMVAAGVPTRRSDHAAVIVGLAFEMQAATTRFAQLNDLPWTVRIGIHSGEVVAGVIGKRKFSYDLWGDTVNVASRIESTGAAGEVRVSIETATELNSHYRLSEPTCINLRGHGSHDVVTVLGKE